MGGNSTRPSARRCPLDIIFVEFVSVPANKHLGARQAKQRRSFTEQSAHNDMLPGYTTLSSSPSGGHGLGSEVPAGCVPLPPPPQPAPRPGLPHSTRAAGLSQLCSERPRHSPATLSAAGAARLRRPNLPPRGTTTASASSASLRGDATSSNNSERQTCLAGGAAAVATAPCAPVGPHRLRPFLGPPSPSPPGEAHAPTRSELVAAAVGPELAQVRTAEGLPRLDSVGRQAAAG